MYYDLICEAYKEHCVRKYYNRAYDMIIATTPRWLKAQKSLLIGYMEKNLAVHVIAVSHVCHTDMTLEQFLKSSFPPIKCVIVEQNMKSDVFDMDIAINKRIFGRVMSPWCPNCCQPTNLQSKTM